MIAFFTTYHKTTSHVVYVVNVMYMIPCFHTPFE